MLHEKTDREKGYGLCLAQFIFFWHRQSFFLSTKKRPQALFEISNIEFSAFQHLQHLLQFRPQLADDLVTAVDIILGAFTFKLLPGTTDGETLFIQ